MIVNNTVPLVTESGPEDSYNIYVIPWLILAAGCFLSIVAALWSLERNVEEGRLRFERRADRLVSEIQRRIDLPASGLRSIRGLYLSSETVTGAEFKDFLGSRDFDVEFPGAIAFGYIERVGPEDLDGYIAQVRQLESPDFDVHPKGGTDDYYVVRHIAPMEDNESAWGFNLASEARRRTAVRRSIDTGEATISARIDLVQDELKLASFLYLLPVYKKGTRPEDSESRQENLMGLASVALSLEHTFAGLSLYTDDMFKFDVFDGREGEEGEALFLFESHLSTITGFSVPGDLHQSRYHLVRELVVGGRAWTIQLESLRAFDGTVDKTASFLFGIGGVLLTVMFAAVVWALGSSRARALALAQKMTGDLAQAKARADLANNSKSEFLANMSHEIRTPLTAILGYATILRDEGNLSEAPTERMEAVNTIVRGGEHLLQIINDILDLSKIEAGKIEVESIAISLRQVLGDIEGLMSQRAKAKNVTLQTKLTADVPDRIISDPTRLRQVLMNLVGNAVKFTEVGEVTVSVSKELVYDRNVLRFEIRDTGPGMEADQARILFKPFTQADGSVTRKHGGTGLGLTISRRLAQSMRGSVRLDQTEIGVGSVFIFEVPLIVPQEAELLEVPTAVSSSPAPEVDAEDSEALLFEGAILLAEDNQVNQRLIQFHLQKAGAQVELARDGQEALEKMLAAEKSGNSFGLLLTDMQMPRLDGYSLARELRRRGFEIPIIALTAHAMAEDRQKCLDSGCSDYVTKPIDKNELIRACNRLVK